MAQGQRSNRYRSVPAFCSAVLYAEKYWPQAPVDVVPVTLDSLPPNLQAFDSCFSMGVFYHRRSPMDHLRELRDVLRPGGELILETLIIPLSMASYWCPVSAMHKWAMYGLSSVPTLLNWLAKIGFKTRCVDVNQTTCDEQRTTDWMSFNSLQNFYIQKITTSPLRVIPRRAALYLSLKT